MDFLPLPLRGILIGFAIAAPVGPIGLLCIQRTLAYGRRVGFVSGLGAASADAIYGMIAGLGLTAVSGFLVQQQSWLRLIGGLFLCYLGIKTIMSHRQETAVDAPTPHQGMVSAYVSILALTLTNPITILSFVAVFAGLGLATADLAAGTAVLFVLGVFSGSALWWLLLSGGAGLFRNRIQTHHLAWINRVSGAIILTFGIIALWQ
ncbi:MAG: LysE family transporter [Chloroflexi bacterium]|nr:LysE family transporter [Chloroflexota bacterium]